jgi:hypothetical protein
MKKEIWKPISGFEGAYEVSNLGAVRSLDREIIHNTYKETAKKKTQFNKGKVLTIRYNNMGKGYAYLMLYLHSKHSKRFVHRLVAQAFIKNPENKSEVNHIDGNPRNNDVSNLEWNTRKENLAHAIATGLHDCRKKIRSISKDGTVLKFDSIKSATAHFGCDRTSISRVLNGKAITLHKHFFEYDD